MTAQSPEDIRAEKDEIRALALARRDAQPDKGTLSRRILDRLLSRPEYARAGVVLFYVDVRSEVRTRPVLPGALQSGKKIVVPYCVGRDLTLFHLQAMDELTCGTFGILEPRPELRRLPQKLVAPAELDLIVVPGLAFDRRGGRLGHGAGYFDKLLAEVRPETHLAAPAFQCQLFPEVPMQAHDVFMHEIVTERAVYRASC